MKFTPRVGDVFLIPLGDQLAAGGHLIAIRKKHELYLAVFDQRLSQDETDPSKAIAGNPVFLALTFDAKLFHGDWSIIGNLCGPLARYPEPAFKVKHAGVMSIESRDKCKRRPASEEELELLHYRSVAAPILIEDAIKAYFGFTEWSEDYDHFGAEYARSSSVLI